MNRRLSSSLKHRRKVGLILSLLLFAFILRVVGQLLVMLEVGRNLLPPMKDWYSGLIPYEILLPIQLVLIVILLIICLQFFAKDPGRPRRRPSLGRALRIFGLIYLSVMILRFIIYLFKPGWLGGWIPIVFHWVLACYCIILGRYHSYSDSNLTPSKKEG